MILNSIYLENFRSFNSQGFTLSFSPNSNTIIGENNVGKTTIFEALRILLDLKGLNPEDFHKKETKKKAIISIECTLDNDQIKQVISALNLPYSENDFINFFAL